MQAILWNINKRNHSRLMEELLLETSAEIAVIPECPRDLTIPKGYARLTTSHSSLSVLAIERSFRIVDEDPSRRFAAATHAATKLLLIGCHLPSKLHRTEEDSLTAALRLREFIESVEKRLGHERTLVLGDMNMDPYELGMVHCEGLHAVMAMSIAERGTRIVQNEARRFFYNPMWGHYGDTGKTASATYFYSSSRSRAYFWHMYDQVLLRPSIMSQLKDISIIESIGSTSLVSDAKPLTKMSDHLPLRVQLTQ